MEEGGRVCGRGGLTFKSFSKVRLYGLRATQPGSK